MQQDSQKVKTKVRFTSLDVSAMVSFIRQNVIGQRVTNIYDVNPTTYLFKLSAGQNKNYLLVENGVRFHVTATKAQKNKMPTGFTMKFRKFLRAKRLEKVRQVGMERVVVLTFGSENFTNHLILELYSQGNIILTDDEFKILQCIRSHQFTEEVKTAVGEFYPFEYAANIYLEKLDPSKENILEVFKKQEEKEQKNEEKKGKKKAAQLKLKQLLMKVIPCLFPQAAEHIILNEGLNPNEKCNPEHLQNIEKVATSAITFLKQFQQQTHQGYLYYTQNNEAIKYFDYSPFAPKSYANKLTKTLPNFSEAVDLYYADFKRPENQDDLEGLAWKKYQQIKTDQDARMQKLINDQEESQLKAQLIEKNIDDVDAIIKIMRTLLDGGLSWGQIQQNVNESKKRGDPLAELIHAFNLGKDAVTVLLSDPTTEGQLSELLPVDINVGYNAYTNAKYYYEDRKKNKQKQIRTKEASEQVLKIAEKEALKDIERKKNQRQQNVINVRKPYWFQKFYWMLTSQGYLVISGRDSHQNQLLVKKYMKIGDLYMHSDYGGAASTIIKNPTRQPLTRPALEQAAIFTVCRSKAWDTKIISGAWWVNSDQVSKSAPTGEFLPTGSFMIRGKKNFIYPNKMEMGVTLLYRLDQASATRHLENKKPVEEIKVGEYQLEIERAHQQKLKEEEFSIVSLQVAKKKGQQQQNKGKQQTKQTSVATKQKPIIDEKDQESDEEDSEQDLPQLKKGQSKQQKQKQKQKDKQKQNQPNQPAKKNKKKLKKLQKYLQEQDEEEREIIMKMLGAKQMKHRRQDESEQEVVETKGKKDKYNLKQKKNKDKFNLEQKEEKKLDKEKIPFLMKEDEPVVKKDNKQKQKQKEKDKNKMNVEIKKQAKPKIDLKQQQQVSTQEQKVKQEQGIQKTAIKKNQQIEQTQTSQNQDKVQEKQEGQQNLGQTKQKEQLDNDSDDEQEIEQQKQQDNYEQDQKVLDSDMNDLTRLSGVIRAQDTYDALIAMCAPYPTISDNRFKIKLTPGAVKKGKAARNILNLYTGMQLTDKEKMMLRGIPEQQVINCLLSGVKLAGAGLLKLEQKEKAQKKEKRKEKDREKEKERQKEKNKKK